MSRRSGNRSLRRCQRSRKLWAHHAVSTTMPVRRHTGRAAASIPRNFRKPAADLHGADHFAVGTLCWHCCRQLGIPWSQVILYGSKEFLRQAQTFPRSTMVFQMASRFTTPVSLEALKNLGAGPCAGRNEVQGWNSDWRARSRASIVFRARPKKQAFECRHL